MADVEKRSRETNSSLKDIEKNLKFNLGNTELVAQQDFNKLYWNILLDKVTIDKDANVEVKFVS